MPRVPLTTRKYVVKFLSLSDAFLPRARPRLGRGDLGGTQHGGRPRQAPPGGGLPRPKVETRRVGQGGRLLPVCALWAPEKMVHTAEFRVCLTAMGGRGSHYTSPIGAPRPPPALPPGSGKPGGTKLHPNKKRHVHLYLVMGLPCPVSAVPRALSQWQSPRPSRSRVKVFFNVSNFLVNAAFHPSSSLGALA